ncbi:MAG: hypothetical protein E6Q56_10675 [Mycobacterium sp.]|nr:hypothetical protein [Mycobacterium sp.]TXI37408.1 MAG: hypothetical protein E6Q56_10675 [Mycobacterium sp.]
MSANDASIAALRSYTKQRSDDVRQRIEGALRDLRRRGAAVNVAAVANRAGVTRKAVYAHPDLLARIRAHSRLAPAPENPDQPSNSIIDALRRQITTKEAEITKLRAKITQQNTTIATLYGQLEQSQT